MRWKLRYLMVQVMVIVVRLIVLVLSVLLIRYFFSIFRLWLIFFCWCNNLFLDCCVVGCVCLCIDISLVFIMLFVSVLILCICNDFSGLCGNIVGVIFINLIYLVMIGELNQYLFFLVISIGIFFNGLNCVMLLFVLQGSLLINLKVMFFFNNRIESLCINGLVQLLMSFMLSFLCEEKYQYGLVMGKRVENVDGLLFLNKLYIYYGDINIFLIILF